MYDGFWVVNVNYEYIFFRMNGYCIVIMWIGVSRVIEMMFFLNLKKIFNEEIYIWEIMYFWWKKVRLYVWFYFVNKFFVWSSYFDKE